ncbi:MAG: hypothetical protein IJ077_03595 [Eubacterium sp.]|nr:hypothetical protein [Eubacterium sp.]MBR2278490.1 hypothetical protein [Eubacterium sp.]
MRNQSDRINKNLVFVAFGAGCAIALCLPTVWTTRILAVVVIILGLICCKSKGRGEYCESRFN